MKIIDPNSVGISTERLKRVDAWMEEQINKGRLTGCSLLLGRRGQIAYFNAIGYAELETQKPFQEDTIVRIFSMTKPVTTVAAMMLYEENYFQLDDPILDEIRKDIENLDINTLTPVEALMKLNEIKKKIGA